MIRAGAIGLILFALLGGCATAPDSARENAKFAAPSESEEAAAAEKAAEQGPPGKGTERPQLSAAEARKEVQKILLHAFNLLDAGEEEKARAELEYANQLEPENKQVSCLLRGITADPLSTLGKESNAYTIRLGETLGLIARRVMGDVCEFYILARYNDIKVPKQVAVGQVIRIPGRAGSLREPPPLRPAPAPAPKPLVTEVPPKSAVTELAPKIEKSTAEPVKSPKPSPEISDRERQVAVDRHSRNAQAAYRRQDLKTAIREWDAMLVLDPGNNLARARRQEAIDLEMKIRNIGK